MMISFHSKTFDVSAPKDNDDSFYGEDLARWLEGRLVGWKTSVVGEDWGWAVLASKGKFKYMFGVYDHDTNEVSDNGPRWVLRLFNRRDRTDWFKKLFKHIPPKAHQEVIDEVVGVLRHSREVSDISVEPL
jgi:hypothetical protein